MKIFRLTLSRIATHFVENKLIFILFFLGILASSITIIFYYGNLFSFKNGVYDDFSEIRAYTINLRIPQIIDKDEIIKMAEYEGNCKIQDIIFSSVLDENGNDSIKFDNEDNKTSLYFTDLTEAEIIGFGGHKFMIAEAYLNNNANVYAYPEPQIFNEAQQHELVAVAPKNKPDTIKIANKTYNVVSKQTVEHYIIPVEKLFSSGVRIAQIKIYTENKLSENMMYRYSDYLENNISKKFKSTDVYVEPPKVWYNTENDGNKMGFSGITAIAAISLIAFMFLLKYMMLLSHKNNVILMMVGAKKSDVLKIVILENIILVTGSVLSAVLLHSILYQPVFSKVNIYGNIVYYPMDYLNIYLIILLVSLLVNIPFFVGYYKNNIREARNRQL